MGFMIILNLHILNLMHYNSSGLISLNLVAVILLSIGSSFTYDTGGNDNKNGLEKLKNKDYTGAVSDFNKAVKAGPYNAAYYYNRGLAHWALGERIIAIENFRYSVELNPNQDLLNKTLADAKAYVSKGG
jgi:tetratricopeptide (TPR) repeat protein